MDFRFQKKGLYQWYSAVYHSIFHGSFIIKQNDLNFSSFANYDFKKVKVLTYCTTGSCHIQPSLESRAWAYLHYSHLKRLNIHKLYILYIWISNLIWICPTCPTLASPCSNRQALSPLLCWVGENAAHCRPRLSPATMTSFWWRKYFYKGEILYLASMPMQLIHCAPPPPNVPNKNGAIKAARVEPVPEEQIDS